MEAYGGPEQKGSESRDSIFMVIRSSLRKVPSRLPTLHSASPNTLFASLPTPHR